MSKINQELMEEIKHKCSKKVSPPEETKCQLQSPAIGIDFGTTNSCVGVWESGRVKILEDKPGLLGCLTTPSCVAFTKFDHLVGDAARSQIAENPANTIYDVKRLIGRELNSRTVQDDLNLWPFEVVAGSGIVDATKPMVVVTHQCEDKQFTAEEITAMVLMKMKENAESYLGSTVKNVVITVPAYFNDTQRQATHQAGVAAGFNVIHIIDEPIAVAIAYGFHKKPHAIGTSKNVLLFDLGGGALEVSLLSIEDNLYAMKAVSSDTALGGRDFDNRLVSHFVEIIRNKFGEDISRNRKSLAKLRKYCERAKIILSSATWTTVHIDLLRDGIDFSTTLTRELFEKLNSDLFERCIDCVKNCLEDGKINRNDIHRFVLVGGSTKIPKIQKLLKDFFRGTLSDNGIDPDTAVASGAAIISAIVSVNGNDKKCLFSDMTPSSLGLKIRGGGMSVVVERNSIPGSKKMAFTNLI